MYLIHDENLVSQMETDINSESCLVKKTVYTNGFEQSWSLIPTSKSSLIGFLCQIISHESTTRHKSNVTLSESSILHEEVGQLYLDFFKS